MTSIQKKILIYAQDPGGTRYMGLVLRAINESGQPAPLRILVHPLSQDIVRDFQVPFESLTRTGEDLPISVYTWIRYLEEERIAGVFCTISSPYLDLTNCYLIVACRKLSVPAMGIMDHWKGYDRFYQGDKLEYMPHYICCIDDSCKKRLQGLGLASSRIFVVGHPYLEAICRQNRNCSGSGERPRVLLVSQPDTTDRSFNSIYSHFVEGQRLIDQISSTAAKIEERSRIGCTIHYRPHPKERPLQDISRNIAIDVSSRWDQALKKFDVFIGLDSMAMVEAHLAGKYCIALELEAIKELSETPMPFSFCGILNNLADFPAELVKAMNSVSTGSVKERVTPSLLADSTERTIDVFERFASRALSA